MYFDLTHARLDPAHCLAPGLFRSLKRGERKKYKLDITYNYGEEELRFVGFEPLGADDQRLLQGVIALAGPNGLLLEADTEKEIGKQLRLLLNAQLDAAKKDSLIVQSQLARLLREIGYEDGGDKRKQIIESLRRMSNVTVLVRYQKQEFPCQLLAYWVDEDTGSLFVCLNFRLAEAVLGRRAYARIEMHEVRALTSDPARLIHQRLCGWIDPGKTRPVELDTLCSYVWPDQAEASTMRTRRQTTRKALDELRALGWTVAEYAKGKFEITRPKTARPPGERPS